MYANSFATDRAVMSARSVHECVGVADAPRHVRHVFEQVLLVHEPVVRVDLLAVDADGDAAQRLQLQAGCRDDHVGVETTDRTSRRCPLASTWSM